jgi:hypothetical protein
MATRTKPQFEALYGTSGTEFADNTTGDISAGDIRAFGQDIADSVFTTGLIISKVTIPSASILTAFTTPVTLIAAQGAGTIIEVNSITIFLDYNSAAYATNTNLQFGLDGGNLLTLGGIINQTNDYYYSTQTFNIGTIGPNLAFKVNVQTGNPTAGNSPLYVYLTYRVITL